MILQAQNGLELYQFLQQNIKDVRLDFVLLDLEMPIMNGYVTCQKICELYDKNKKLFEMQQKKDILEEIKEKPFMVACTGFLNSQIELEAEKAGFDVSI